MQAAAGTCDHRLNCQAPLAALRMLARDLDAGVYMSRQVVTDVILATSAILAEAEMIAGAGPGRREQFLRTRLDRLAAAAQAATATARLGHRAELRRELIRFEALTSAIWAVDDGLTRQPAARPARHASPA